MTEKAKKNNIAPVEQVMNYLTEKYDLRFNKILNDIEIKLKEDSEWQTANVNDLYIELQINHYKISQSTLTSYLASSFIEEFNMIKNYFEDLESWTPDKPDYIEKLTTYINVLPTDRERFINNFKKMCVRTIACALGKSVNKQVFTFVSREQNTGKSTFWRWFVPPDLMDCYKENLEFDGKDTERAFANNFIINLDELANISKENIEKLKTSLSKKHIKIRLPYAKNDSRHIRICSFVASTNRTDFLTDPTGNVRWDCFKLLSINFKYDKELKINDIWAQAYYLFKNDFKYDLTPDEIKENEKANESFMNPSNELDALALYFKPSNKDDTDAKFFQHMEILGNLNKKLSEYNIKLYSLKLSDALVKMNFEKVPSRRKGVLMPIYGYWVKEIINQDFSTNENIDYQTNEGDKMPF